MKVLVPSSMYRIYIEASLLLGYVAGVLEISVEEFRHAKISSFGARKPVEVAHRESMYHSPTVECPILDTHAR